MSTPSTLLVNSINARQAPIVRRDIADWRSAKLAASRVSQPRFALLQELYSHILDDAHLSSQLQLRRSQTLSAPFELLNAKGAIDTAATDIANASPLFNGLVSAILDSLFFGFSLVELAPLKGSEPQLCSIDRRHVDPTAGRLLFDQFGSDGIDYRSAKEYGRTVLEFLSPDSLFGILDRAVPHVLYKRFAQACWSEYCEICGIPIRYIKTNTQDPDLRARYEEMLQNQGSNLNALVDTDDDIGFIVANNSSGEAYQQLIRLCTNELSLLISGAVMGQDTEFGSRGKEQASSDLANLIAASDRRFVEQCVNKQVLPSLAFLGVLPQGLHFQFATAEDLSSLFSQTMQAAQFFDIDPKWVRDKFGIEVTGLRSSSPALALNGGDDHRLSFFL